MNKFLLAGAVLASVFLMNVVVAQEGEEKAIDVDQVIAMCEEQFPVENNPDEAERNRLIDECIETKLNAAGKPAE